MPTEFMQELKSVNPPRSEAQTWVFVPYDQLTDRIGPLANSTGCGIILVENARKANRRPYHKQKLALILTNMRHFALEQARKGRPVEYLATDATYAQCLDEAMERLEIEQVIAMRPAERELRVDLEPLVDAEKMSYVEHAGWLTSTAQFEKSCGEPPWRMDAFYRQVRKDTGILMDDGSPEGGKYSHDHANRKAWSGEPPAPEPPRFEPDAITREVGELIEQTFPNHPGQLDLTRIPASHEDAQASWSWALDSCMQHFGPYEDAMSTESTTLFHTRISHLLNIHRLLPSRVVEDVLALDIPLNSKEGFVRQVIGWREFMRHVHEATDGFRTLPGEDPPTGPTTDGGWSRWSQHEWPSDEAEDLDAAYPSALGAHRELPSCFWGDASGLHCLDRVVESVWSESYSHHITRLMILGNLATLLDIEPRQITDWFWVAYDDAYDWVVEPNVLGMATFGVGELFTTKPYVSGSNYIRKMSDYCQSCEFDPRKNCPITRLYWAFLERNYEAMSSNRRMNLVMGSLRKRSEDDKDLDRRTFEWVRDRLDAGVALTPEETPS